MSAARLARRLLSLGLVAAAVVFLAVSIGRNWRQLAEYDWQVQPGWLLLSVAAHVAVLAFGVWVLSRVVALFGEPLPFPALLRIWAFSNAARYIPGTVWQFVAAAQMAKDRGVSRVLLLTSLAVHLGLTLLAAAALAVATLPLASLGLGRLPRELLLAAPLLLLLVHPRVVTGALALLHRLARREVLQWRGSWAAGIGLVALAVANWLLYGGAFWLFLRSIAPFPAATLLPAAGINAASFLAGWVVFFAPGGAGFREAAMAGLLTPYVPFAVAAAIAVLSRLWSVAAELGVLALALLLSRRTPADTTSRGR